MSPDPGEIDHETRGWTHRVCGQCWPTLPQAWRQVEEGTIVEIEPGVELIGPGALLRAPSAVVGDDPAPCCYCGATTDEGIYTRQSALEVHGDLPWDRMSLADVVAMPSAAEPPGSTN